MTDTGGNAGSSVDGTRGASIDAPIVDTAAARRSGAHGLTSRTVQALSGLKVEWLFLVIALTWGLAMVVITPPFQAFDEQAHYYRAWSFARGEVDSGENGRVTLPENVVSLPTRFNFVEVFRGQAPYDRILVARLMWEKTSSVDVETRTSAAKYGPLGYLPQTLGIGIVEIIGRSPLLGLYLGRLLNMVAAVLVAFAAIRLVPVGKPILALLALFPTTLFVSSSLSPDALAMAGSLLLVALVLRYALRPHLSSRDMVVLGLTTVVLMNLKPGYLALGLLIFLLRPRQVGGWLRYWLLVAGTLGLALATTIVISRIGPNGMNERIFTSVMGAGTMSVSPPAQLGYIFAHPWGFTKVVLHTLADSSLGLASGMVGSLGWGNVAVWSPMILLYWLGLAVLIGASGRFSIGRARRALLLLTSLAVMASVMVGLYVYATAVAYPMVVGLQGRYFAPAMAPLLLSFAGISVRSMPRIALILIAVAAGVLVTAVIVLKLFYY